MFNTTQHVTQKEVFQANTKIKCKNISTIYILTYLLTLVIINNAKKQRTRLLHCCLITIAGKWKNALFNKNTSTEQSDCQISMA